MNTKGELLQELSRRWLDVDENLTTSEVLLLEQLEKELNGLHPKYHEQWYNTLHTGAVFSEQDKADLIEFCKDHIEHFNAIPLEFETSDGIVLQYNTIWDICDAEGLLETLR